MTTFHLFSLLFLCYQGVNCNVKSEIESPTRVMRAVANNGVYSIAGGSGGYFGSSSRYGSNIGGSGVYPGSSSYYPSNNGYVGSYGGRDGTFVGRYLGFGGRQGYNGVDGYQSSSGSRFYNLANYPNCQCDWLFNSAGQGNCNVGSYAVTPDAWCYVKRETARGQLIDPLISCPDAVTSSVYPGRYWSRVACSTP